MSRALVSVALVTVALGLLAGVMPAAAQTPVSAVLADSIRVGDPVPVAVRVTVDRGQRVLFPDTLPLPTADMENVARVRTLTDTLQDRRVQVTGVYTITPWRPGDHPLPDLTLAIAGDGGETRTVSAGLPVVQVVSILPADAELLDPMPARGVIGPSFALWPFVLLGLALLAAAAIAWWWLRRRRPVHAVMAAPAAPPRELALAALDEARRAGLVENGEWKEFYTRVAHALRDYLEAIEPGWSEDLTTSEVIALVRANAGREHAAELAALLRPADQVKFARRAPDAETAIREWQAARDWVERFDGPPRPVPTEAAA